MSEGNDPRLLMSTGGTALSAVSEHWMEGDTADGSTGVEFSIPAGAVSVECFADVDAFCGAVAEASLDIAGSDMNAEPTVANQWSLQTMCKGLSKFSIKARTGNLGLVVVRWGGTQTP